MKIEKNTMEVIKYLHTLFNRSKIEILTGGYPKEEYLKALDKVLAMPFGDEITIQLPDGTYKTFKATP